MFSKLRFKDFTLSTDTNEVIVGAKKIKLTPKEMGVLELLNDRSETTVTREELLENVWGAKYANDQGLTQAVSRIRGILSQTSTATVITVPKKGYQLQKRSFGQRKSTVKWIRSYAPLLALVFVGLVISFLILTDQVKIRITKDKVEKSQSTKSQ